VTRWTVIAVALLLGCKDKHLDADSRPYALRTDTRGTSLALAFPVQLPAATGGVRVKAACQFGVDRLVEVTSRSRLEPTPRFNVNVELFAEDRLPAHPTSCEVTATADQAVLRQFCIAEQHQTDGPCRPNVVQHIDVGPSGVTGSISAIEKGVIRYRVTAHKDMPRGAYLARFTTCTGRRNDDTWTPELEVLRAGETLRVRASTAKLADLAPGTECETELGYATSLGGEVTPITTVCHRDTTISPGPCRQP